MAPQRQLLLIELNEFSVDLFHKGVRELGLQNIARMLRMQHSTTTTDDQVEHRGLDPWVQWVSVHTGLPSTQHHVIHLGDAPAKLGYQQLWETLGRRGITSGIWGAMNATRGTAEECRFFLPDPWTFMEEAYPPRLNDLLALPRYYSKSYLDVSKWQFFRNGLRLAKYVLGSSALGALLKMTPFLVRGVARTGLTNAFLFSAFDLFSATLFIEWRRMHRPQLSVIFLNSIAHLQHHRWDQDKPLTPDLVFGLETIDKVLGSLFAERQADEALVVMNALTQRNIVGEKPRICYRQINPLVFLQSTGLRFERVEQLMTNDAHVFFANEADRDTAANALSAVLLEGVPFFHVEASREDARKLFFQIDFWDELAPGRSVEVNGRTIAFDQNFEAIVARTGAHVRNGDVFFDGLHLPATLYNHEVGRRVVAYMDPMTELGQAQRAAAEALAVA